MKGEFYVGQRVEAIKDCLNDNRSIRKGYQGIVISTGNDSVGVEWDDYVNGHFCSGRCKMGHGWYVTPENISPIEDFDVSIDGIEALL